MGRTYKIIIAGTRTFDDFNKLEIEVKKFILECVNTKISKNQIEIVSGTAPGADKLGEKFAKKYGFGLIRCPALWDDMSDPCIIGYTKFGKKYNKLAGPKRNEKMAKYATHCVVFWDGISDGSKDMITRAENHKLVTKVIKY